ncbi:hypothetical protein GCM10027452_19740 [Micromonospora halotolerans]
MPRIELTTDVRAVPEAVFDACLDVGMHTESMGTSAERAVGGVTAGRLKAGDAVTWEARHFGLPWRMTVRITDYRRPHGFTDEQISGPFGRWHHEHSFTPHLADSSAAVPATPHRTSQRLSRCHPGKTADGAQDSVRCR